MLLSIHNKDWSLSISNNNTQQSNSWYPTHRWNETQLINTSWKLAFYYFSISGNNIVGLFLLTS